MRHPTAVADAVRAEVPAPCATRPVSPLESLLARMDRASAGALEDHARSSASMPRRSLRPGACGGSSTIPPTSCARSSSRAKTAPGCAELELHLRWLERRLKREGPITSPAHTSRYVVSRLRGRANEVFAALFLDNRHRVIAFEELFQGTVDGASVHPRVEARPALALNAAALVACNNHPSGVAEPSLADRAITGRLRDALALIDVRLVDHFVVGDAEVVSFAERGRL